MSNPQLIKAFVQILDTFMNELEQSFPHERDIRTTRTQLKMLASVNPKMIVTEFVNYLLPYKTPLFEKDMVFFMDLSNFELDQASAAIGSKIVAILRTTTDENTNIVFAYMQKLLSIGEKISV